MYNQNNNLIPFANLYNVRHLGGLLTSDGKKLKDFKYIRGSAKGTLSDSEKAELVELGVKVIIDLRYGNELEKLPSPLKDYPGMVYYHVDMMGEFWQMRQQGYNDLSDLYIDLIKDAQDKIKQVFTLFASYPGEGIYFHCTAGKDRTGVITMILLDLLQVSHEEIVANYAVSYEFNKDRPGYKTMSEEFRKFTYSYPQYMETALKFLYDQYGNAEQYLLTIGMSIDQINLIKASAF